MTNEHDFPIMLPCYKCKYKKVHNNGKEIHFTEIKLAPLNTNMRIKSCVRAVVNPALRTHQVKREAFASDSINHIQ